MSEELPEIPGYSLGAVLGKGAFGLVVRARQISLRRDVAIKLMKFVGTASDEAVLRFEREIQVQKGLDHPHLVRLYDAGSWGDGLWLAMELVEGGSVSALVKPDGTSVTKSASLVMQAAEGLAVLHERGIIHRDVKPGNLLLDRDGKVKIADYGLARSSHQTMLTEPGTLLGTPGYLPPEVFFGDEATPAADVYSLGVVLHELVTGVRPFRSPSFTDHVMQVTQQPAVAPSRLRSSLPRWVDEVTLACLEKDPGRRIGLPALIAELRSRAAGSGAVRSGAGGRASGPVAAGQGSRRRMAGAGLAALALAGLTAFVAHRSGLPRAVPLEVASAVASPAGRGTPQSREALLGEARTGVRRFDDQLLKVRGNNMFGYVVRSQDAAGEFIILRSFQDLLDGVHRAFDRLPSDDPADRLVAGYVTERVLQKLQMLDLPADSSITGARLPELRPRLESLGDDPLGRTLRASLEPFFADLRKVSPYREARIAGLEALAGELERLGDTGLPLEYWAEVVDFWILTLRFQAKGTLVTGYEETAGTVELRIRMLHRLLAVKPSLPEDAAALSKGLRCAASLIGGEGVSPVARATGLKAAADLLEGVGWPLPPGSTLHGAVATLEESVVAHLPESEVTDVTDLRRVKAWISRAGVSVSTEETGEVLEFGRFQGPPGMSERR